MPSCEARERGCIETRTDEGPEYAPVWSVTACAHTGEPATAAFGAAVAPSPDCDARIAKVAEPSDGHVVCADTAFVELCVDMAIFFTGTGFSRGADAAWTGVGAATDA